MAVERCKNNLHYYDTSLHSSCPYCGVDVEVDKTFPKRPDPVARVAGGRGGGIEPTMAKSDPGFQGADPGVTQGIIQGRIGIDPVVGWLVCIDGPDKGMDYRIRAEMNWIGRSEQMRICIAGDSGIARDKHAAIAYDPNSRTYHLVPGISNSLVSLNGHAVFAQETLKHSDRIKLGGSELVFIPFDPVDFRWI